MGIREDVLALAGDVESTIGGCYGCLLDKRGLCKAETDFDCNDEVCKLVAHRLRAIVEHEAESVTTVSAYDLLPEEDREALRWVREMGGIEEVKNRIAHAKPEQDSWERIEEDATRMPGEYCERYGIYGDSFPQAEAMACDLVRRCRALAERGA